MRRVMSGRIRHERKAIVNTLRSLYLDNAMPASQRLTLPSPPRDDAPSARQVPAVTRAIAILRLLGKTEAPLGVNAIARALGLIPSTCPHILRVLVAEELVSFDAKTKLYNLDAG